MNGLLRKGGRPRVPVDLAALGRLRAAGASWRAIGRALGISAGTARSLGMGGTAHRPRVKTGQKPSGEELGGEKALRYGSGVAAVLGRPQKGNGPSDRLPDLAVRLKDLGVVLYFRAGCLDPEGAAILTRLPPGVHEAWLSVGQEVRKR